MLHLLFSLAILFSVAILLFVARLIAVKRYMIKHPPKICAHQKIDAKKNTWDPKYISSP